MNAHRILVTGATGGLGRNAVQQLLAQGARVRATGRNTAVGQALQAQGAEFLPLDLATAHATACQALLHDVDAVWHCAALSAPWGPAAAFEAANVRATQALLQAAGTQGVRCFVHISTPALYFDHRHLRDIPESFLARRPVNAYARTKGQAEQAVQQAAQRFPALRCVLLRPRAIFGPHDQVLMPRLLRVLDQRAGRLPLPRGGAATLDLTYVDNVVQAMALATANEALPSGSVFNITNQQPAVLKEVLHSLFHQGLGRPLRIVSLPHALMAGAARAMGWAAAFTGREPLLTPYSVGALHYDMTLSNTLAREQLGYRPQVSLDQGLARTANWLRRHG
jgi:nucleoside-diphosphate-sugar epimerase